MTRKLLYVCHPLAGDIKANLARAERWLKYLRDSDPSSTYIAPWIADIHSGADDTDPNARERGLVDCTTTVVRCDGVVLVGGRVSSGMARERDAAIEQGRSVFDLTSLGEEPPGVHEKFDTSEGGAA